MNEEIPLAGDSHPKQIGDVVAYTSDGVNCPTYGDHLHRGADLDSDTSLWRNVDRPTKLDDDGLGFDPIIAGYDAPAQAFCSDTWIFKVHPTVPATTDISPCDAPEAVTGLTGSGGAGTIDLRWDHPHDDTITAYEVRKRSATSSFPDGAGTSSVRSAWDIVDKRDYWYWSASCANTPDTSLGGYRNDTEAEARDTAEQWYKVNCDWEPILRSEASTTEHIGNYAHVILDNGGAHTFNLTSVVIARDPFGIGDHVMRSDETLGVVIGKVEGQDYPTWSVSWANGTTSSAVEMTLRRAATRDPIARLEAGAIGTAEAFNLRSVTADTWYRHLHDDLVSLGSARVDIKPHQVSVVHRVTSDYPHRYLLCDEVGLGKTRCLSRCIPTRGSWGSASAVRVVSMSESPGLSRRCGATMSDEVHSVSSHRLAGSGWRTPSHRASATRP